MDYKKLYLENQEFRAFVDRCRRPGKKDADVELDDFLARKTVRDIGDYFEKKPASEASPIFPVSPYDFCNCEDKSC